MFVISFGVMFSVMLMFFDYSVVVRLQCVLFVILMVLLWVWKVVDIRMGLKIFFCISGFVVCRLVISVGVQKQLFDGRVQGVVNILLFDVVIILVMCVSCLWLMIVLMLIYLFKGLLMCRVFICVLSLVWNWLVMFFWMIRCDLVQQICFWLKKIVLIRFLIVLLMFVFLNMIYGDLLFSLSVSDLFCLVVVLWMWCLMLVDLVKVILLILVVMIILLMVLLLVMIFIMFLGRFVCWQMFVNNSVVSGVCLVGFRIIVFLVVKVGVIFYVNINRGKFYGII